MNLTIIEKDSQSQAIYIHFATKTWAQTSLTESQLGYARDLIVSHLIYNIY